jgi:hypothetical protein
VAECFLERGVGERENYSGAPIPRVIVTNTVLCYNFVLPLFFSFIYDGIGDIIPLNFESIQSLR